jgi:DNA mismatch endonuclease (patch repair protein)
MNYLKQASCSQIRYMSERFSNTERSRIMAAVKSKDTSPELMVRSLIHKLGYRYRLHRRDLPGTPDIVLPALRKVINVHGCFWHLHSCKHAQRAPVKNAGYWQKKRLGNALRDRRNLRRLRRDGWCVLVIWECQIKDPRKLRARIESFLRK